MNNTYENVAHGNKPLVFTETMILVDYRWAKIQYQRHVYNLGGIDKFHSNGTHVQFNTWGFLNAICQVAKVPLDTFEQTHLFWAHHNGNNPDLPENLRSQGDADSRIKNYLRAHRAHFILDGTKKEFDVLVHTGAMRRRFVKGYLSEEDLEEAGLAEVSGGIRKKLLEMRIHLPQYYEKGVDQRLGMFITKLADQPAVKRIIIASGDGDFLTNCQYAIGLDEFFPQRDPKLITIVTNSNNDAFSVLTQESSRVDVKHLTPDLMNLSLRETEYREPRYSRVG